jgi:hypothetical protein
MSPDEAAEEHMPYSGIISIFERFFLRKKKELGG